MEWRKLEAVGGQLRTQFFQPKWVVGSSSPFFFRFHIVFVSFSYGWPEGPPWPWPDGLSDRLLRATWSWPGKLGAKGVAPVPCNMVGCPSGWCESGNIDQMLVKYKEFTKKPCRIWRTIFFSFSSALLTIFCSFSTTIFFSFPSFWSLEK